ncbi:hypothetical protein PF006_g401 [Phytophthora fragariae]|uniref:Chorein N-terminal domain-containing protein n=1 Tax=Phytophthora fragariae TaxID=53985 RepID=A0A6A3UYW4_9STRA|nr:hypothetical protein PF011_g156 [Phytophthora fragariae]KAE9155655.1 hypothetical protein PF006_g401 [Phytophthora fragariae]
MIFEVLQQVLGEFFVDVQARNVSFYAGDLFESSHFKLSDVFLKTALINALQLPFELSAGYIGNVKIEGLVGAVAGWPLEVSVSDVCLVLRPHKVQWDNELLIRYAKELVVAMLQCLGAPSATKKGKGSLFSPAKWIASRVQAVGAEMIVQVERIHIRVESPRTDCDNLVAYGFNIPLIRFAPRELEEQILYRRQQPGVIYPKAVDGVMSKLLTVENVSFYADLDADAYWTSPAKTEASTDTTEQPVASALLASPEVNTSSRQFTHEDALKRFKECVLKSFARDKRRELVHVRVVWIKLDLVPGEQNTGESGSVPKPVLAAVDIATEEIELNIDFDQIAVILEELEHVVDYFKRFRTWKWRPSCIDREHHTPPSVKFFPAWILNPAKVIPLLNLQIGPVTLRLSEGNLDQAHKTKRGIGIEVGFESCSGAMLLTRTPFLRILVEIRVGLFHVTLVRQQNLHDKTSGVDWENGISEYKWISSDYIRLPEDGFFYIGLKYSAQEVGAKPTGRVQFVGNLEEELGLKGRMCIGPIKIDCNEAAMRLAMGQTVADELRASTMDVSTSTHFSILQDAYHSFVNLVAHLPKRKGARKGYVKDSSPRATKRSSTANADPQDKFPREDQQKLEKSAKRTRMLHALLLRSSMFEVEVGTLELNLSAYTSHIEKALRTQVPKNVEAPKSSETREDVKVMLPTTMYRLQNRPSMNECIVDIAGARVVYRSTKQGRAAVIRHLAQLFKL